jgi:hypothetical protein
MHLYADRLFDHIAQQEVDPPIGTAHIEEQRLLRNEKGMMNQMVDADNQSCQVAGLSETQIPLVGHLPLVTELRNRQKGLF